MSEEKKKAAGLAAQAVTAAVDEKLEAIKQLIFGDNIQEYDEEFQEVKEMIEDSKKVAASELTKAVNKLNSSIEKLAREVKLLQDEKLDRKVMGGLISQIGEQIQS